MTAQQHFEIYTDGACSGNPGPGGWGVIIKSAGPNRYVATTGTDVSNDCTLPGNPCATFAHAVEVSVDMDTIDVAAGTYAQTFTLKSNDIGGQFTKSALGCF